MIADATKSAGIAVCLCFGLNAGRAAGAAMLSGGAAEVLNGLKAPDSSERPWLPPDLGGFAQPLQARDEPQAEAQKDYGLADLIDLAERVNPETKAAWEHARQAAAAVGLVQSEYYPLLALQASAGDTRTPEPLPLSPTQAGFMDLHDQQARPVASLEWVLLDFGRRKAAVTAAQNQLLAANFGFNARHQVIVFKVQSAFYELSKVHGRIEVAQAAQAAALKVQAAAEARHQQGLATMPDVLLARQQAVQAAFDLEDVAARERDAEVALADSIGVSPTVPLRVIDFSKLAVPTNLNDSVEDEINRTLEQRPDLLAMVAVLREKEAEIKRAGKAYYPTLSFQGEAGGAFERSQLRVAGSELPWAATEQPTWGVGLALNWSWFDGGARRSKLAAARAASTAAQRELEDARDQAISQVWQYYSDTKMAIRRLDVAAALVDASEKSYQQTFEGYQHGLSNLVDLLAARRDLSQARYTQLDTRATLLESAAALAFASGDLGPQLLKQTAN
jgi:outer membrane protein TolC